MIESEKNDTEGSMSIDMDEVSQDKLVKMTKGFSGADLKSLGAEAAMMPLRSIDDIANVDINNIRPLNLSDFEEALRNVKASVNQDDL
mmetsp:Transcript_28472/g.20564  ORF Transcript_28472/g.20564 Transcript_28472/m.20564 type:complete len:88 (+) Transcript_28472:74-337(+)